jgi:hypothetical protein
MPVCKSPTSTFSKSIAVKTHTSILVSANLAVLKPFSNIYQIVGGNPSSAIHRGMKFCGKTEALANKRVDFMASIWRCRAQSLLFFCALPCSTKGPKRSMPDYFLSV